MQIGALPLFAVPFVYGITSANCISFAASRVREAGGLPGLLEAASPAVVFILYGVFGLLGLTTSRVREAIGLPWLLRALMLAGALSLALPSIAPASWAGLVPSAGLQGIYVMMTSAVLAFWSEKLFTALPSLSFTAALLATAAGSVVGPAIAGAVSQSLGPATMFLSTAALPALLALALPARIIVERPLRS